MLFYIHTDSSCFVIMQLDYISDHDKMRAEILGVTPKNLKKNLKNPYDRNVYHKQANICV
jgi:hypothetical protein